MRTLTIVTNRAILFSGTYAIPFSRLSAFETLRQLAIRVVIIGLYALEKGLEDIAVQTLSRGLRMRAASRGPDHRFFHTG